MELPPEVVPSTEVVSVCPTATLCVPLEAQLGIAAEVVRNVTSVVLETVTPPCVDSATMESA